MFDIWTIIITAICTGSIAWLFTIGPKRKKMVADAEGSALINLDRAASVWKKLNDSQDNRISLLEKEVKELKMNSCTIKNCKNRKTA